MSYPSRYPPAGNLATNIAAADIDLDTDLLDELDRTFGVAAAMQPMF